MGQDKKRFETSEEETLYLYTQEFLTAPQIAKKRGLSTSTIRTHLSRLRAKGRLTKSNSKNTDVPPCRPSEVIKNIRLHGEEFNVRLLNASSAYERLYSRGADLQLDGNRVRLYSGSVEVYSSQVFYGESVRECESLSVAYWSRFFAVLEHRLNALILKDSSFNIRRVKQHFADVNNALAKQLSYDGEKLRVFGGDGREWLIVDNSWGFRELETTHSVRAADDMQSVVAPFFNDLRDNGVLLPSDVSKALVQLAESQRALYSVVSSLLPRGVVVDHDERFFDYVG